MRDNETRTDYRNHDREARRDRTRRDRRDRSREILASLDSDTGQE